jgi:hypothetical protein
MELFEHILLEHKIYLKTEKLGLAKFQKIIRSFTNRAEFEELPEKTTF